MKQNIKYIFLTFLFTSLLVSCGKKEICNENVTCYTEGPKELYLQLKITPSSTQFISVSVYKGTYDKGEKIDHFFTQNSEETYLLPINERYTATAKYVVKGDTIMVIDSGKLGDGSYTNCDESCYDWEETLTLDLQLND